LVFPQAPVSKSFPALSTRRKTRLTKSIWRWQLLEQIIIKCSPPSGRRFVPGSQPINDKSCDTTETKREPKPSSSGQKWHETRWRKPTTNQATDCKNQHINRPTDSAIRRLRRIVKKFSSHKPNRQSTHPQLTPRSSQNQTKTSNTLLCRDHPRQSKIDPFHGCPPFTAFPAGRLCFRQSNTQ